MARSPARFVAGFDSSSAHLRALAAALRGRPFPAAGVLPPPLARAVAPAGALVNALPVSLREQLYIASGWAEAVPPGRLDGLDGEAIAGWMAGSYPRRRMPALAIGSSNGALLHLWAALGAAWLPQTFLVPVRWRGVDPDDPARALEAGRAPAAALLAANPSLQLHHLHDENQDRLMIRRMTYFRVKWRRLPDAYRRFARAALLPGGTLFLVDCRLRWPVTGVGERHVFQHGAPGDASVEEYRFGGPRVAYLLARYGSSRRRWQAPAPDGEAPEAEWGFEPSLAGDVEALARELGARLVRVTFEQPEEPSPLVADLHRWWYARRGEQARGILAESFLLCDPLRALEARLLPLWLLFAVEPSARLLERYAAAAAEPARVLLFSHGTESIGLARPKRWRQAAGPEGRLLAVDERAFPRDFGTFLRYGEALRRLPRRPPPAPLAVGELDEFLAGRDPGPVRFQAAAG